jgi:hypothetical protein
LWVTIDSLVKRDHGPPVEGTASFHTTRRTIVMRSAQSQVQGGESVSAELCRLYWYPLYMFARRRGHSLGDAQGLFLPVPEYRAFRGVEPLKGNLRSFLLAPFQNDLWDAVEHARRLKRGTDKVFVSLDAEKAEERYQSKPIEFLTATTRRFMRFAMPWLHPEAS